MQTIMETKPTLDIPEAPEIRGLSFRNFCGESDFPKMIAIIKACKKIDRDDHTETVEDMARDYSHLTNSDPDQDLIIAEMNNEAIAYSRVSWRVEENSGNYIYNSFAYLVPEWRRKGIGLAILRHNQRRLRAIAADHPKEAPKFFEAYATNLQEGALALLENDGYQTARRFYSMTRPDLENIPDLPLPDGLEVCPVRPEQYRQVWNASQEAFHDHWGYCEPKEEDYQNWRESKYFQPDLWQVAWDGAEVAGMILNFINHDENAEYGRKRGYTEEISVRRSWRRRGLARALLARSLKMHRDLGMTEAGLGVDTENLSGANRLYESMGFRPVKIFITLRKTMDQVITA